MVMYMRGKFLFVIMLLAAVFCLTSCVKSVECPADELRMYSWSGIFDNESSASLNFWESYGYLDFENEDESLHIGGLCMTTDDCLLILDEQSGMNYSFGYRLYGDRVELHHNGSVLSLKKIDSD